MSAIPSHQRWNKSDFLKLAWGLIDALLVVLLLNCAYSIFQYGVHRNEARYLQEKIRRISSKELAAQQEVKQLVLDTIRYGKEDPGVLPVLRKHGIDPEKVLGQQR